MVFFIFVQFEKLMIGLKGNLSGQSLSYPERLLMTLIHLSIYDLGEFSEICGFKCVAEMLFRFINCLQFLCNMQANIFVWFSAT